MTGGRAEGGSRSRSVRRTTGVVALAAHVLLVPGYFAFRWWDVSKPPFGVGHWPGESGWPAGSGSSEWGPGVLPVMAVWLLVLVVGLCTCIVGGLVVLIRRLRRFFVPAP